MRFGEIQGNENVVKALVGLVDSGKIPHAIMFHEDDGGGAVSLCLAFIQYLDCKSRSAEDSCGACPSCNKVSKMIHPDVHFVFPVSGGSLIPASAKPTSLSYIKQWRELVLSNPFFTEADLYEALGIEGKATNIAVAESRYLLDKLSFNALEGGYKSVVIYLPEKMGAETANRLLKSIEEPSEKTQFLLVTHAPEKVLSTISSRCQCIRVAPVRRGGAQAPGVSSVEREIFDAVMGAIRRQDLFAALEAGEQIAALPSKAKVKSFYNYFSEQMRKVFLYQQGLPQLAVLADDEEVSIPELARGLKRSFARASLPLLDRAAMLTDRNVNVKIVACNLVNKLYINGQHR